MNAMEPTEPLGLIITNVEQQILEVDDRYVDLVARERRSLIGSQALSFTCGHDLLRNQPLLNRLSLGGPGFSIVKRYVQGDGSLVWVQNHVTKVGGPLGSLLILATSRQIDRPAHTDSLRRNHVVAKRLCLGMIAGRRALGADLVWAPAIELLLRLYRTELEGRTVCVEELARDTDANAANTLRWIRVLLSKRLIEVEDGAYLSTAASIRISQSCERVLDDLLSRPVNEIE